jgi:prefoldin subunit 5
MSLSMFFAYVCSPDAKTVMVDTGVGVHVEFELTEAVAFIDKRVGVLESKATALNNKAAGIKSHMKLVRQGMQELAETVSADVKARQ